MAFYLVYLNFRVPDEIRMLKFWAQFCSKTADNGRYYRPIISVTFADYRYRPISIFAVSVVHYYLCIHKSLDLHNSGGSKMSLFYVEVTDDQKVSEGGGK